MFIHKLIVADRAMWLSRDDFYRSRDK